MMQCRYKTPSTLLMHRHMHTHKKSQSLYNTLMRSREVSEKAAELYPHQQRRLSDGNTNYADLTTKLLQISVAFGMNITESISARTPLPGD